MSDPLFLVGMLIAVLFALSAKKMGFYHAWTMLFNLLIAVYLAIRVGPFVEEFFPPSIDGKYSTVLALLATGTGAFLIMQVVAYILMVGQLEVTFPRVVSIFGSAFFGFLAGFLVWSFAMFAFYTTPFSQSRSVKELHIDTTPFQETKMQSYLVGWCNFVDMFIKSGDNPPSAKQAMIDMMTRPAATTVEDANSKAAPKRTIDSNEPNQPPTDSMRMRQPHTEIPP
jgi:hypothetical protein